MRHSRLVQEQIIEKLNDQEVKCASVDVSMSNQNRSLSDMNNELEKLMEETMFNVAMLKAVASMKR